jgi:dolichyl-phosphate beta-glucosyltransferase
MTPRPKLSIIIPAYNEEKRLGPTLERICDHFGTCTAGLGLNDIEVIIVNDGSLDLTAAVSQNYSNKIPGLRLVSNETNRGKGYSVRRGMSEAQGDITLFSDADLSSPIEESGKLIAAIKAGNDVAIGSRALDRSLIERHQSVIRECAGIIFNCLVRLLTGLPFHDTQCGFKAFSRKHSRIIFEQQRIQGFGFDPEVLFLARRHNLTMIEVPVRWSHDTATRVHVLRDSVSMLLSLFYIRWNWILDRYPRCSPRVSRRVRLTAFCKGMLKTRVAILSRMRTGKLGR